MEEKIMTPISIDELCSEKDDLKRVQRWMRILETCVFMFLQAYEPKDLKPAECERAITRHLSVITHMIHVNQQSNGDNAAPDRKTLLDALLRAEAAESALAELTKTTKKP